MRSTRHLLLLAIALILAIVGAAYYIQKRTWAGRAPKPPEALPLNMNASATGWNWAKTENGRPVVEIHATDFREMKDPPRIEIQNVELRLFHKDALKFDRIRSASAQFRKSEERLYSEGDVEITMGMPADGAPAGRLIRIRTSGVTFDSRTGRASTERLAKFDFDQGEGKAVGASYDPIARELQMNSAVELKWRGGSAANAPMLVEAGRLVYREDASVIQLSPWSRLRRANTALEAADATIELKEGAIDRVQAARAKGSDKYPNRSLTYAADALTMDFTPEGAIEKVTGERNATLSSASTTGRTTMRTDRVDLDFAVSGGDSLLKTAFANGNSVIHSEPAGRKGAPAPQSRRLASQTILMSMRPGGSEIDHVETHSPGTLEFLAGSPGQRHRRLDAERMWMYYGAANQLRSFRAVKVATRTDPALPRKGAKPEGDIVRTFSADMDAAFDEKTGQMTELRQSGDFRYEEGDRRARAERARLEEAGQRIVLESAAKFWDPAGSTSADSILIDQRTGDMRAEGDVISTRLPDRAGKSSAMLAEDQPFEAKAKSMTATDRNRRIRYEGDAFLWQGPNRIRADRVDIDRLERRLTANGAVRTQFLERSAQDQKKPAGAPAFIMVESAHLVYTDKDRLADYTGGAHLTRPGMDVKSERIRAYLSEGKQGGSSLDRAYADGKAVIVRSQAGRTRTGKADHIEYRVADATVILNGGDPVLEDSARGFTRGRELTYYINDDKLLVSGAEAQPAVTRLPRK